jgi:hypothetical protein
MAVSEQVVVGSGTSQTLEEVWRSCHRSDEANGGADAFSMLRGGVERRPSALGSLRSASEDAISIPPL